MIKTLFTQNKLQKSFLHEITFTSKIICTPLSSFSHKTSCPTKTSKKIDLYPLKKNKSLTPYLDLITLIIINKKTKTKTLIGFDPHKIVIPINKSQLKNTLQTSTDLQIAFLKYFGEISFHYLSNKL